MKNPFLGSLRPCKRCGRQVFSSKMAYEHPLGGICSVCIKPEERKEIEEYLLESIMKKKKNPKLTKSSTLKCNFCGKVFKWRFY